MKTMKIITAVGLILALSAPAWALSLGGYTGPIKFKFSNWDVGTNYTNLYGAGGELGADRVEFGVADLDALTQTGATGAVANEDAWFIFQVTSIRTDNAANDLLWNDGDAGEVIVGIGYGLRDVGLWGVPGLDQEIIYSDNLHLKMFLQPQLDGGGNEYFDALQGTGGRSLIDPTSYNGIGDLDGDGDFDAADEALGAVLLVDAAGITGIDIQPNQPALDDDLDALPAFEHIFKESSMLSYAYLDANAGQWGDGNAGNGELISSQYLDPVSYANMDWTELFMTASNIPYIPEGANDDWDLKSEDPVRTNLIVPEPLTMCAVFGSLVGLGGYIRKRRTA